MSSPRTFGFPAVAEHSAAIDLLPTKSEKCGSAPPLYIGQLRSNLLSDAALLLQGALRGRYVRSCRSLLDERAKIAWEILTTERVYCRFLDLLLEHFIFPLKESAQGCKPLLAKDKVASAFPHCEAVALTNHQLLEMLESKIKTWSAYTTLGDVFLGMVQYFKVYIMYAENFENMYQIISARMNENASFKNFLRAQKKLCDGRDLDDLVIMPIQRIPRYVLLLQQLLSKTPKNHKDFALLTGALQGVRELADTVNTRKGQSDGRRKILQIYDQLQPPLEDLVQPHRQFVMEEDVCKVEIIQRGARKKTMEKCHLFLFNDILLICTNRLHFLRDEKRYTCKSTFHINQVEVRGLPCEKCVELISKEQDFHVIIFARSDRSGREWLTALTDTASSLRNAAYAYNDPFFARESLNDAAKAMIRSISLETEPSSLPDFKGRATQQSVTAESQVRVPRTTAVPTGLPPSRPSVPPRQFQSIPTKESMLHPTNTDGNDPRALSLVDTWSSMQQPSPPLRRSHSLGTPAVQHGVGITNLPMAHSGRHSAEQLPPTSEDYLRTCVTTLSSLWKSVCEWIVNIFNSTSERDSEWDGYVALKEDYTD